MITRRTLFLAALLAVTLTTLVAWTRPRPTRVGGRILTAQLAPDSLLKVSLSVTLNTPLKAGERIRYRIFRNDTIQVNRVVSGTSWTWDSLPAPDYSATANYKPCGRVVYTDGTQSLEKCGALMTFTRGPAPVPPTQVEDIIIRPAKATLDTGATMRFCAYAKLTDGSKVMTTNSAPFPECQEDFEVWLTETQT